MDRPYNSGDSNVATFFIGTEVEHTPAHGKKTLFVVGLQPVEEIERLLADAYLSIGGTVDHIYFGANMSFPNYSVNDSNGWTEWENMIIPFLDKGYWCTLDIDSHCAEGLVEGRLCEYSTFIPMLSVKLPYVQLLGYNATIKLDDKDFKASNPGVWCHSLHELRNRRNFTDWSEYTKDEILK